MANTEVSDEGKAELNKSLTETPAAVVEENEEQLFKMRAKLYRWASEADPPQWKERGTGDVQLLQNKETSLIRLVMRRDKTLKVCANHYVDPDITLKPHGGSDRAWVWNTWGDLADGDEEPQKQMFAIRLRNEENATSFKDKFVECQDKVSKQKAQSKDDAVEKEPNIDAVNQEINKLVIKDADGKDDETKVDVSAVSSVKEGDCNETEEKNNIDDGNNKAKTDHESNSATEPEVPSKNAADKEPIVNENKSEK